MILQYTLVVPQNLCTGDEFGIEVDLHLFYYVSTINRPTSIARLGVLKM